MGTFLSPYDPITLSPTAHKHEPGLLGRARSRSGGPGEDSPSSCPYLRRLLEIGFTASFQFGVGVLGPIDRLPPGAHQIVGLERIDPLPAQYLADELEPCLEFRLDHFVGSPRGEPTDVTGAGSADDDVDGRIQRAHCGSLPR